MNFHGVDSQFRLMGPLAFGFASRFLFSGLFFLGSLFLGSLFLGSLFLGSLFLGLAVGESLVPIRSILWV